VGRLDEDTALVARDDTFEGRLSPEWAYVMPSGGFTAALMLRAVGERANVRFPASFACVFLSPPSYDRPLVMTLDLLKGGMRSEVFRVRASQSARAIAEAHVWTCAPTEGLEHDIERAPAAPPREQIKTYEELPDEQRHPPFPIWKQIEERRHRWTTSERPPSVEGWFAFRPVGSFEDPFVDAGRSLILIDALVIAAAKGPHPDESNMATSLDLRAHFHRTESPLSEWLYALVEAPVATFGRYGGRGKIWDESGRIVASGSSQMYSLDAPTKS
jgi:acyl-CoA thioesterase-2